MSTAILLAFVLAQPSNHCNMSLARGVAQAARKAGQRYDIPPSLLASVVVAETGCRNVVVPGVGKGRRGCDVGFAQIHVPECEPSRVAQLLDPVRNLKAAAFILDRSRDRCTRNPPAHRACKHSQWSLYNPRSPRWWAKVNKIWKTFKLFKRDKPETS